MEKRRNSPITAAFEKEAIVQQRNEALERLRADRADAYHIDAHSFLCGFFARQTSTGVWVFDPPSGKTEERACAALDAFEDWWKPNPAPSDLPKERP
jgi:hypothetical protein